MNFHHTVVLIKGLTSSETVANPCNDLDDSRDLNNSRDFDDTSSLGLDWLGNKVLAPAIFLSAHEL